VNLLAANPGAPVPVSLAANDEGLDVLAHADWRDSRAGRWVFVGQATVAKSDQWESKASDASASQWMDLLSERLRPAGFLAVPHHIQNDHWSHLLYTDRLLLDRLRLCPWLTPVAADELEFVHLCGEIEVEALAG
jgi:hypothetical protein